MGIFFLLACSEEPQLTVKFRDPWGQEVTQVELRVEGTESPFLSGSNGQVEIPLSTGELRLWTQAEGYLEDIQTYLPPPGEEAELTLQLYPVLESLGFQLIGLERLLPLEGQKVLTFATQLETLQGIRTRPQLTLRAEALQGTLFHSQLSAEELARLGMRLSRLEYVEETRVNGLLGEERVEVHLWQPSEELELQVRAFRDAESYLIQTETLRPGVYAFHSRDVFQDASESTQLPAELRVAYPFEILPPR